MSLMAFVGKNRAGMPCLILPDGTHDAYPTHALAAAECDRRNRVATRIAAKRAAREIAQSNLGQLAKRLRVGLRIMPDILPCSAAIAKPFEKAVCA